MHNVAVDTDIHTQQIHQLQVERRNYVERIANLMRFPERRQEVEGYLKLIDQINEACSRLARLVPRGRPAIAADFRHAA